MGSVLIKIVVALFMSALIFAATRAADGATQPSTTAPAAAEWPKGLLDWRALNAQALDEATQPLRPGVPGQRAFWNSEASFFIYAPAFDFAEVKGANSYRFTVSANAKSGFTFEADKPWATLTPIWKDLPMGDLSLTVEGLDAKGGKPVGQAGTKSFNRKTPYLAGDPEPALDYDQAVREACQWMFNSKYFAQFKEKKDKYDLGKYPAKFAAEGVVLSMTLYARLQPRPVEADQALEMARNAARALIAASFRADALLPHFPPTYDMPGKDKYMNNRVMMNVPAHAGWCYLELYDLTKEEEFLQAAIRIGETYRKCQLPNGTWPIVMLATTGEVKKPLEMIPTDYPEINVIGFIERLVMRHGQKQLQPMLDSCEKYLREGPVVNFNPIGMFEDMKPSSKNLSGNTSAAMAIYLFTHAKDDKDIQTAEDLVRLGEDLFIFWKKANKGLSPAGYEQYACFKPVCCSASFYMDACMAAYRATGKKLYLAKAITMANAHVEIIRRSKGCIPTWWRPGENDKGWPNCPALSAVSLARFAAEAAKIRQGNAPSGK